MTQDSFWNIMQSLEDSEFDTESDDEAGAGDSEDSDVESDDPTRSGVESKEDSEGVDVETDEEAPTVLSGETERDEDSDSSEDVPIASQR